VRQAELWTYVRPSRPDRLHTVVITSSDAVNDSPRPWLLGIPLRATDPEDILAVPIRGHGWAYAGDVGRLLRAWCGERTGQLDAMTWRRLHNALALAQDF